jgi:hypothetical protein
MQLPFLPGPKNYYDRKGDDDPKKGCLTCNMAKTIKYDQVLHWI